MRKIKFYQYATGLLLLLNVSMLVFFFVTKPPGPLNHGMGLRAIDQLDLDQTQHDMFLKSADWHRTKMNTINTQQSNLLRPYFSTIIDTSLVIDQEATLQRIQALEREKIQSTYQHFREVKAFLRPEQQDNYAAFMQNQIAFILDRPNKETHPPKDF